MKHFKDLFYKTFVAEEYTEGGSVFNGYSDSVRRTAMSDFGVHRIGEGDSIHRLNAFISKYLGGTYIDPEAAINELRSRLNHAGLDFIFEGRKVSLHPGTNIFPAKLFGEVFGTTPTTDLSKGFDHGMDLPGLNLVIEVAYSENSCMYTMSGKLVPTPKTSPVSKMNEAKKRRDPLDDEETVRDDKRENESRLDEVAPLVAPLIGIAARMVGGAVARRVGIGAVGKLAGSAAEVAVTAGAKNLLSNIKGDPVQRPLDMSMNEDHKEHKADLPRKVEHFIMRNKIMKNKVLIPVYNHLLQKKKQGKLTLDDARKELYFVVNTAMRKIKTEEGNHGITLTQDEKGRVVNDLVRNFKKYATQHKVVKLEDK